MKKRIIVILLILVPFMITGQIYQNAFDILDLKYDDSYLKNDWILNSHEGARYRMSSYLVMYKATNDVKYLKKLVHWISYYQSNRDDKKGRENYRGEILPTWSNNVGNLEMILPEFRGTIIVHSGPYGDGNITYPMADFVQLVLQKDELKNVVSDSTIFDFYSEMTFYDIAIDLITKINETIMIRDYNQNYNYEQWDNSMGHYRNGEHYFLRPYAYDVILPYNQELTLGLTLLYMNKAYEYANFEEKNLFTRNGRYYKNKIDKLAINFFNDVSYSGEWHYWPLKYRDGDGRFRPQFEDLPHGVPEITFACEYYKYYPSYYRKFKLTKIAKNVENKIYKNSSSISFRVNGDGILTTKDGSHNVTGVLGAYMPLTAFNHNIYNIVLDIYQGDGYGELPKRIYEPEKTTVWWGYDLKTVAYLEYYKSTFSAYGFNRDPGPNSNFAGIASGDCDNDGKDEIMAVRNGDGRFLMYNSSPNNSGKIEAYTSFTSFGPNSNWSDVEAGDFDGDGIDEFVAARNSDDAVAIIEYDSYPLKVKKQAYPLINANWAGIGAGDFDNTLGDEFVIINNNFVDNTKNGFYIYQYNNQTNSIDLLNKSIGWGVNSNWSCVAGGDYDGDLKDEFVVIRNNTSSVASQMFMYRLDGNNNFQFIRSYTGKTTDIWKDVSSIDIDGDNVDEFIALNEYDGNLYLFKLENNQIVLKETIYFPKKHEIAAISSGNFNNTPQDELIIVRNLDGDLFAYTSNLEVGSLNNKASILPISNNSKLKNTKIESLSIEDNSLIDTKYKLYPNPAKEFFFLEFNNTKQKNIQVFNLLGRKLIDVTSENQKIKFNLPNKKGIYLVVIRSEGERFVEKLIVK